MPNVNEFVDKIKHSLNTDEESENVENRNR